MQTEKVKTVSQHISPFLVPTSLLLAKLLWPSLLTNSTFIFISTVSHKKYVHRNINIWYILENASATKGASKTTVCQHTHARTHTKWKHCQLTLSQLNPKRSLPLLKTGAGLFSSFSKSLCTREIRGSSYLITSLHKTHQLRGSYRNVSFTESNKALISLQCMPASVS